MLSQNTESKSGDDLNLPESDESNSVVFENEDIVSKSDEDLKVVQDQNSSSSGSVDDALVMNGYIPVDASMFVEMLHCISDMFVRKSRNSPSRFNRFDLRFWDICDLLKDKQSYPSFLDIASLVTPQDNYWPVLRDILLKAESSLRSEIQSLNPEKTWQMACRLPPAIPDRSWYKDLYQEQNILGCGGFGTVVKVENSVDKKTYAVKKIEFVGTSREVCMKVLREARIFSNLEHCHIVRYHSSWLERSDPGPDTTSQHHPPNASASIRSELIGDFGSYVPLLQRTTGTKSQQLVPAYQRIEDILYCRNIPRKSLFKTVGNAWCYTLCIQMELCGQTLQQWLCERNKVVKDTTDVDCERLLRIQNQVLLGVDYIHKQNLLHRDLKPANIFLNGQDHHVKIGDFGLARPKESFKKPTTHFSRSNSLVARSDNNVDMFHGDTHTVGVGTTLYAAPEQKESAEYTNKVDIYSLGVVFYELFRPFHTDMERVKYLSDLPRGVICEHVQKRWQQQCEMMLKMTQRCPDKRPAAEEIIHSNLFGSKDQIISRLRLMLAEKDTEIQRLKRLLTLNTCKKCDGTLT